MVKNWLLSSFILLWLADCFATLVFIGHHGIAAEDNPLMRYLLETGGPPLFFAAKIGALLPVLGLHDHMPKWVYVGLNIIMVPVAYMGIRMAVWPNG